MQGEISTPPFRGTPEGPFASQVPVPAPSSLTPARVGAPGLALRARARALAELHARLPALPLWPSRSLLLSPPPTNLLLPSRTPPPLAVTARPALSLLRLVRFSRGAGPPPLGPRPGVASRVGGRGRPGHVGWRASKRGGGAARGNGGHFRGVVASRQRLSPTWASGVSLQSISLALLEKSLLPPAFSTGIGNHGPGSFCPSSTPA